MGVADNPGKVFSEMWHATSAHAGKAIVTSQKLIPSTGGQLGAGVYASHDRVKAEGYPLPGGYRKNKGVMLRCRVRMGRRKVLGPYDRRPPS